MPKTATTIAYFPNLPEFLEAGGFRVRLEVQRADGKPLSAQDHKTLALMVDSCENPSDATTDELADAVEAELAAERKASKASKASTRTKRAATKTAARVKAPARKPARKAARRPAQG